MIVQAVALVARLSTASKAYFAGTALLVGACLYHGELTAAFIVTGVSLIAWALGRALVEA